MPKHKNRTILVTGVTGHQGSAVLRHLRERGFTVRGLTRDPDKPEARRLTGHGVEIVPGDMEDPPSLIRAMDGVAGAYSVQDWKEGVETEVRDGINMAEVARHSVVDHFVYSSVASADRTTGLPHFESKFRIEEHIRSTGLRHTILRPVFFMENLLGMKDTTEQGTLTMPLDPETRLQMVAVDDIGAFAAMAFEHPGRWANQVMELAGDELSMQEIAEAIGLWIGREVRYVQIPWDTFEQQAGPERTKMFRWFQSEGFHADIIGVRLERPGMLTFGRWLRQTWPKGSARPGGSTVGRV
jgi:uncharacterized protein YbjT (DUF2867 family)